QAWDDVRASESAGVHGPDEGEADQGVATEGTPVGTGDSREDEAPGGGQADAAVAPGDDRDFPFQLLRHGTAPLPVSTVRVTGYEYVRPPHHALTTTLPICWFDSR